MFINDTKPFFQLQDFLIHRKVRLSLKSAKIAIKSEKFPEKFRRFSDVFKSFYTDFQRFSEKYFYQGWSLDLGKDSSIAYLESSMSLDVSEFKH